MAVTVKDLNEFCEKAVCNGKCEKCKLLSPQITRKFSR